MKQFATFGPVRLKKSLTSSSGAQRWSSTIATSSQLEVRAADFLRRILNTDPALTEEAKLYRSTAWWKDGAKAVVAGGGSTVRLLPAGGAAGTNFNDPKATPSSLHHPLLVDAWVSLPDETSKASGASSADQRSQFLFHGFKEEKLGLVFQVKDVPAQQKHLALKLSAFNQGLSAAEADPEFTFFSTSLHIAEAYSPKVEFESNFIRYPDCTKHSLLVCQPMNLGKAKHLDDAPQTKEDLLLSKEEGEEVMARYATSGTYFLDGTMAYGVHRGVSLPSSAASSEEDGGQGNLLAALSESLHQQQQGSGGTSSSPSEDQNDYIWNRIKPVALLTYVKYSMPK